MQVDAIATPELGDRSYVVSAGSHAVVIDPQRDLDRVHRTLDDLGADVGHVLETHVHNDYVSGGLELARRCSATYGVNAADPVVFDRHPLRDGDVLTAGPLRVEAIATPGHTDTHLAFVVTDGDETAIFSGGSLLFGSVGRTDLVDPGRTRELAHAQFASTRRLATGFPTAQLFPTHGFGSFCSSGAATERASGMVADEFDKNPALRVESADAFVDDLVASLGDYPTYYAHMAPVNLLGAAPVDLSTPVTQLSGAEVAERVAAGGTVIDLRDRVAYAASHAHGTISIPLSQQLATYLGWLVPFGTPLTLIGSNPDDLDAARRQLVRIGYDELVGTVDPVSTPAGDRSFRRATFDDLAVERRDDDVVLDVRRREERADGAVRGSVHIPVHEVPGRLGSLPRQRVWVHCVSGFRAGTASSILANAGFEVVQVDDHVDRAYALGL